MKFLPALHFTTDPAVRRLRWVTLLVMLADAVITIVGQPPAFWQNPRTAIEGEPIVRFFLVHGVLPYAVVGSLYVMGVLVTASLVPRRIGLTLLFFFLLEHFMGFTSWFLFRFDSNLRLQQTCELVLAALITLAVTQKPTRPQ